MKQFSFICLKGRQNKPFRLGFQTTSRIYSLYFRKIVAIFALDFRNKYTIFGLSFNKHEEDGDILLPQKHRS